MVSQQNYGNMLKNKQPFTSSITLGLMFQLNDIAGYTMILRYQFLHNDFTLSIPII